MKLHKLIFSNNRWYRVTRLVNVKKRLQLLYAEKHFLEINSSEDVYQVHLRLTLQQKTIADKEPQPSLLKQPVYG